MAAVALMTVTKAADIADDDFLAAVAAQQLAISEEWNPGQFAWANRFDVADLLGAPEKVVLAKARRLIRRGLMDGCVCGCRGDFMVLGYEDWAFVE